MLKLACRLLFALSLFAANAQANEAVQLDIQGAIGPAVAMNVHDAIQRAEKDHANLVILRMDTPGGLDLSMRKIIQDILASKVPVATYVAPQGARAASAGTYILYASHIAAMAPATNLGAATPIQIGGMPGAPESPSPSQPQQPAKGKEKPAAKQPQPEAPQGGGSTLHHKMVNDATAYIRSLAELRGRNAEWAEKAVRQAASLSAEKALKEHVIDLIATDDSDLLKKIDGRTVKLQTGEATLHTAGMTIVEQHPNWRSQFLAVITDPNIAYILMLLGVYGLFFELANPGFVLPGVIGGICLLLALFAFQVLPINFAGLALILLGIGFMIAEVFVPSFGALGIGGVIAFVVGSLMLMDTNAPGYAISLGLILGVALTSAVFFIFVVGLAVKARLRPVVSGSEELIGAIGITREDFDKHGTILIHSESWNAETDTPLKKGQEVRVVRRHDLTLFVEPAETSETPDKESES